MAIILRTRLEGASQTIEQLRRANPARNDAIPRKGLLASGELVAEKARAQIRDGVGPPVRGRLTSRTGRTRASIKVDRRGVPQWVAVGPTLLHARLHELGLGKFPARPFLAPALEEATPRFQQLFEDAWQREIDEALS